MSRHTQSLHLKHNSFQVSACERSGRWHHALALLAQAEATGGEHAAELDVALVALGKGSNYIGA